MKEGYPLKIAVLYIGIGKYIEFWNEFYQTAEENFLPQTEKEYFIFTDRTEAVNQEINIHVIYQKSLGWPYNTLKRFHFFKGIKGQWENFDYIYFFNANVSFAARISEDILPDANGVVVIEHPGYHGKKKAKLPYEAKKESLAYVPLSKRNIYVQGAVIGGGNKAFMELVDTIDNMTEQDLEKGIIPIWHDESYLNRYILDRENVKILGWEYLYYEEYVFPYEKRIVLRKKKNKGRYRGQKNSALAEKILDIKLCLRNLKMKFFIKWGIIKWVK